MCSLSMMADGWRLAIVEVKDSIYLVIENKSISQPHRIHTLDVQLVNDG